MYNSICLFRTLILTNIFVVRLANDHRCGAVAMQNIEDGAGDQSDKTELRHVEYSCMGIWLEIRWKLDAAVCCCWLGCKSASVDDWKAAPMFYIQNRCLLSKPKSVWRAYRAPSAEAQLRLNQVDLLQRIALAIHRSFSRPCWFNGSCLFGNFLLLLLLLRRLPCGSLST